MNIIIKIKTIIIVCLICLSATAGTAEEKTFKLNLQKLPPYPVSDPHRMLGIEIFEPFQLKGKIAPVKQVRTEVDPLNFVTTESTIIDLFRIRYTREKGQSVFVESLDSPSAFSPLELKKSDTGSGSAVVKIGDSERTVNISTFGAPVPQNGFRAPDGQRHWGYKFFMMADTDIQCKFHFTQVLTAHKFSVGAREYQVRIPNQPNSGLHDFQFEGNEFYRWVGAADDVNTAAVSDLPGLGNVGEGGVLMVPLKEGDTLKDRMEFVIYVIINVPGYNPGFIAAVKWGYKTDYTVGKTIENTVGITTVLPMKFFTGNSPEFKGILEIYSKAYRNLKDGFTANENICYEMEEIK